MSLSRRLLEISALAVLSAAMVPSAARAEANASADRATAPQVELVDVFTNTGQALVYDQNEAQYVLLRAGSQFRGFKVGAITAGQIELFRASNARLRFVITKSKPSTTASGPVDPYANLPSTNESTDASEPVDPYADLSSPFDPGSDQPDEIKTVRAPESSRPKETPTRAIVSRAELSGALDNLDALSREIDLELSGGGTRVAAIGEGTLPYRLGLRRGDVIMAIAGVPTKKLEDGADVFVKLSSAKKFTIELIRDKEPISIPVIIQSARPTR